MSVSELSSDIVAWETDMTDTENVGGQRGTVEISLLHTHLPKMDRAGLISYHEDAETVVLISCDDELDHHLGPVESLATGDD